MNKNTIVLSLVACITGFAGLASPVYADMCTTQYGGTTTCSPSDLTINKQVFNPITKTYVENLTTTDPTYAPTAEVTYRLTVHNGSGETFQANVKDTLPPYLSFVAGPGTYNKDTRVLEFTLENLIAGETRTIEILAKVADANAFPAGKSLFCVVNVAEVRALNRFDTDSTQVCLQNGTSIATTLPVAGFDNLTLLLPFAGVGLGGFALLRKQKPASTAKRGERG